MFKPDFSSKGYKMKKLLPIIILSLLFYSVGFSQQLIPQIIENYKNGNIKKIHYYKKINNTIQIVKEEEYYETSSDGYQKIKYVTPYKDGKKIDTQFIGMKMDKKNLKELSKMEKRLSSIKWNKDGSIKKE